MALGVLASMVQGAGQGVRENAQDRIAGAQKAKAQAEEDKRDKAKRAEARDEREAHYAQMRADDRAEREDQQAHERDIAALRGKNGASPALLASNVKSFEQLGTRVLAQIDTLSTDALLSPQEKQAAAANLYARLDELVENNPNMAQLSPLYSTFYSSAKGFLTKITPPETAQRHAASEPHAPFVAPKRPNPQGVLPAMKAPTTQEQQSPHLPSWMDMYLN